VTGLRERGSDRSATRRGLLAALGGTALSAASGVVGAGSESSAVVHVRTYVDGRSGWTESAVAAHRAVDRTITELGRVADRRLDRAVEARVDGDPPAPRDALAFDEQNGLLSSLRDWLATTDAPEGPVCHLLLADAPLNVDLGYGGSDGHVGSGSLGARTVANVGATETYDGRVVTTNLAIHEALHPLIAPEDAAAVNGSDCEHDLGAVARLRYGGVVVTPMATSYAAPGGGTETRFHGTGCSNRGEFSRNDRVRAADAVQWHHTSRTSGATRAAFTRHVDRVL